MLLSHEHILRIHLGIAKLLTRSGFKREDFSVTFSLSDVSEVEYFVAKEDELSKIHKTLKGDGMKQFQT